MSFGYWTYCDCSYFSFDTSWCTRRGRRDSWRETACHFGGRFRCCAFGVSCSWGLAVVRWSRHYWRQACNGSTTWPPRRYRLGPASRWACTSPAAFRTRWGPSRSGSASSSRCTRSCTSPTRPASVSSRSTGSSLTSRCASRSASVPRSVHSK